MTGTVRIRIRSLRLAVAPPPGTDLAAAIADALAGRAADPLAGKIADRLREALRDTPAALTGSGDDPR